MLKTQSSSFEFDTFLSRLTKRRGDTGVFIQGYRGARVNFAPHGYQELFINVKRYNTSKGKINALVTMHRKFSGVHLPFTSVE